MRSAMIRQTVPTPGAPTRGALGIAADAGATRATGTSTARTAPPGPVPRTAARSSPRSAARRRAFGGAGLVGPDDDRDRPPDGHHVALLRGYITHDAGRRRLDLDRHLVGLDLDDRLTLAHGVPRALEPVHDLAGLLRQLQGGHDDVG